MAVEATQTIDMEQPFGAVVIGAGDMGARHARWWAEAGATIVAVCDPDGDRARTVAAVHGAAVVDGPDAALARDDVHVVSVCAPTALHAATSIAALDAGKHVLCEKPAALRLSDAEAMRAAAERSGRLLRIGFMRRFDPAADTLARWIPRLGGPVLAQATITAGVRPKRAMHEASINGGPLIDMACHVFDQWEGLFGGPATAVRAYGTSYGAGKAELDGIREPAIDSAQVTLRYRSGAVGQMLISWGLPSGVPATERHSYAGPDGLLSCDWPQWVTLQRGPETVRWEAPPGDPWREEIAHFRRAMAGLEHRPLADIEAGTRALRTSLAALTSIAEDREVVLPEHAVDAAGAGR